MTQKEFATILQINIDTLKKWELELRKPPKYVINLIEYYLKKEEFI